MAPAVPVGFTRQRESKTFLRTGFAQMTGKTRKISKGHASGFVPDYRHVVESMTESEGFGSSGRVDAEMTASEDSCAPKKKCISLNRGSDCTSGVPYQVFSVSKMSQSERKDLELRLRSELEQIRILQNKIASMSSGVVVLSPRRDIFSCGDAHKRPVSGNLLIPAEVSATYGKNRAPAGRNGGGRAKKPATGRLSSAKKALPTSPSNAMLMKQCETLLNRLMGHQYGWVFNTPVDVVELKIPDYFSVIKHPMDLGTVKTKLISGNYADPWGFAADVRLTFSNAMTYNPRGNDVHFMAETLSKYFETRWKPIEKKLNAAAVAAVAAVPAPVPKSSYSLEAKCDSNSMPPSKRMKTMPAHNEMKQVPVKWVMSDVEKHKLSTELEALLAELPENIIDFLKESSSNGNQTAEDEIEIDIDTLSDDTLFKLRKLLDDYLAEKQKHMVKAETCEMEPHNESGVSNSSVQPSKPTDHIDEDVDIGGNDLHPASFPSVEIEKDAALRSSKLGSSSSSSSESGSSSSDSDSSSSSDCESDGAKASVPVNTTKKAFDPEAKLGQQKAESGETKTEYCEVEQKYESDPTASVVVEVRQPEGESAPCERQVSPEKLYRAALLRNRFADTILKAQEKTIEKGEKLDPEKLRLEKEELEKRRREEKARLQGEAKAAEEARRQAEAEAAAEAKRRRELEREAARQALQKMEKTVDINENTRFLEDLEMLGVAPSETLQSFGDSASPDDLAQDGLGSFKFQGNSNPLQQLGLFMKQDHEEDEDDGEDEPKSGPAVAGDPEEGEID